MKINYYSIHKNKNPKKLKYSKRYSLIQLKAMDELIKIFTEQSNTFKDI